MNVGFTGTRYGMTAQQKFTVHRLLREWDVGGVRHGDCVGCDEEFDQIARYLGYHVTIHPPAYGGLRAYCKQDGDDVFPVRTFLDRNQAIVENCDVLIATPKGSTPVRRSGTWHTIRQAAIKGVPTHIVYPDGGVEVRNG